MKKLLLLLSFVFAIFIRIDSVWALCLNGILYRCGDGSGRGPRTDDCLSAGNTYTAADNTCTPPDGFDEFIYWRCLGEGVDPFNINAGESFVYTGPDDNGGLVCTAQYKSADTHIITYSCGTGSGDAPSGTVLDPTVAGTNYTYSAANMTWTTNFPYGDVSGIALCSTTTGSYPNVGTPDESGGGKYCWCRVTSPAVSRWVFYTVDGSSDDCASGCANRCVFAVRDFTEFRSALFGSVVPSSALYGSSFTPAASTCTAPAGYGGFNGWLVSGTNDVKPAGTAFTWNYTENKTFTAQWTPNVINLTFDNVASPASCTFGSTFIPPTPEPRPGYVFTGWKIKPSCAQQIRNLDTSTNGSNIGYTSLNGNARINESNYGLTTGSGQWAVEFSYGTVWGMAKCSETIGDHSNTWPESSKSDWLKTPSDTNGQYCWCQATGFTASGNSYTSGPQCTTTASSLWVFGDDFGWSVDCAYDCASNCAYYVQPNSAFRAGLFGAVGQ